MDKGIGQQSFESPGQPSIAASQPSGRWRFAAGLLAGMMISLAAAMVPSWTHSAAARPEGLRPLATRPAEPDDAALAARWETLYGRFLETAAPLVEAFHRVDRLSEELPERQSQAREAEAAYLAARRAREAAEAELATYLEKDAVIEQKSIEAELTHAELTAHEAQRKLDDHRRIRQKLVASWTALGRSPQAAESVAKLLFDKDVWTAENRLQQALHGFNLAKARRDLIVGFEQTRKTKLLRAEIEARRAGELASLAAWEKARTRQKQIQARLACSDLSQGEKRLLEGLVKAVGRSGYRPAPYADRAEMQAFLDRFEAGLAEAGAVSRRLRAARYDDLLDRLVQVHERLGRE
jgi:hypothetical protein